MKQIRNILTIIFWSILAAALLLVVLFEYEVLPMGTWSEQLSAEFLCRCTMEVVALGGIYLALRLFKFQRVHQDLVERREQALQKWGILRLLLLELPMFLNTLLYYMFLQTTYGYLAIIAALSLPFVYPTLGRCMDEVEEPEETPETPETKES